MLPAAHSTPNPTPNQERFRRLIANEDDGGLSEVDGEIAEIKEVMGRHGTFPSYHPCYTCYEIAEIKEVMGRQLLTVAYCGNTCYGYTYY